MKWGIFQAHFIQHIQKFYNTQKGDALWIQSQCGQETYSHVEKIFQNLSFPIPLIRISSPFSSPYPYPLLRKIFSSLPLHPDISFKDPASFYSHFLKSQFSHCLEDFQPLSTILGFSQASSSLLLPPKEWRNYIATLAFKFLKRFFYLHPAVLYIQDLLLADGESLSVLRYLVENIKNFPCLFLLQGENSPPFPLSPIFEFPPLPKEEISQQVQKLFGVPPTEEFLTWLQSLECRSSFFLKQLLWYLKENGLLSFKQKVSLFNPPFLLNEVAILSARLDSLSQEERETLQLAVVLGCEGEIKLLETVLPNRGKVLSQLAAKDFLFIEEESYFLPHQIAKVVEASLAESRKQQLHFQIAQSLEGNAPLEVVAYHYIRSGDREKRREYLQKLAKLRENQSLFAEAAHLYHLLLEELPEESEEWFSTKQKVIQVLTHQQEFDVAIGHVVELLEISSEKDWGKLYATLAKLYEEKEEDEAALQYAYQSLSMDETDEETLLFSKAILGVCFKKLGKLSKAEEVFVHLLPRLNSLPNIKAYILYHLGEIYLFKNSLESAVECYLQSAKIYKSLFQLMLYYENLEKLGELYVKIKNWEKAKKTLRSAIEFYKMVHREDKLGRLYYHLALVLLQGMKRKKLSCHLFQKALSYLEFAEDLYLCGMCHYHLSQLTLEGNSHHLARALDIFRKLGDAVMERKCKALLDEML